MNDGVRSQEATESRRGTHLFDKDLSFRKAFPTVVMVDTERSMAGHKGQRDSVCFEGEDEGAKIGSRLWAVAADYYTVMALQLAMRLVVSITITTA